MIRTFPMLALLMASIAAGSSNPPKSPVRLVLSGPRSVRAGDPLPLHLKLKNISTDQQVRFVEGCLSHYVSWNIHANNGKEVRPRGIEIDCTGSEQILGPGEEKQWAVDPSVNVAFPGSGNYVITAIYTFDRPGSLGTLKMPKIVQSNTLIVSVR